MGGNGIGIPLYSLMPKCVSSPKKSFTKIYDLEEKNFLVNDSYFADLLKNG